MVTRALRSYGLLVALSVLAVVMLLGSGYFVRGFFQARSALMTEEEKIESLNKRIVALEALRQGELDGMKEVVERALPLEKPVFVVLDEIKALASEVGVSIVVLSSSPGTLESGGVVEQRSGSKKRSGNDFDQVGVTVEVEGSFDSLSGFVLGLSELVPLVDISEVKILPRGRGGEEQDFSGELELDVYWMAGSSGGLQGEIEVTRIGEDHRAAYEQIVGFTQ